jgi:hypothetical protein
VEGKSEFGNSLPEGEEVSIAFPPLRGRDKGRGFLANEFIY